MTEGKSREITAAERTSEVENSRPEMPAEGTLVNLVSQSLQRLDLLVELHGKYILDPDFQPIIAKPKEFCNFEVNKQLIYLKKHEMRVLCIPKVVIQGQSAREVVISEAHSVLGQ